jgi:hypothetical protein
MEKAAAAAHKIYVTCEREEKLFNVNDSRSDARENLGERNKKVEAHKKRRFFLTRNERHKK